MPDQKTMWTRCLGGFSVMWVTKLMISPVKKRIFCPKTTKFSPKLAFLSIAGSFGALLVGWLVVVARAVSRKTPIYFIWYSMGSGIFYGDKQGWRGWVFQEAMDHPQPLLLPDANQRTSYSLQLSQLLLSSPLSFSSQLFSSSILSFSSQFSSIHNICIFNHSVRAHCARRSSRIG